MSSKYPYTSENLCGNCLKFIVVAQKRDITKKYCSIDCANESKKVKKDIPLCENCHIAISIKRSRDYGNQFCSKQCAAISHKRVDAHCLFCNEKYYPKYSHQKYCSSKCSSYSQTSTYMKECTYCQEEFVLHNKAYEKRGEGKYCSLKCSKRKTTVDETYFETIDTHNKAYWLGFIFADGYHNSVETAINLHSKDKLHLEKFRKDIKSEHNITTHDIRNIASFRIFSKKIAKDLDNLNCFQAKTLTLLPPKNILNDFLPSFVRGYFDGDGFVSSIDKCNGARLSMHCAGPLFKEWLLEYLKSELKTVNITNPKHQNNRNICISNIADVLRFKELIYSTPGDFLERKFDRFEKIQEKYRR